VQGFLNGCGYPAPADCGSFGPTPCICQNMAGGCASLSSCLGGPPGGGGAGPGGGLPLACRECFVKAIQGPCANELAKCKANPDCQSEIDCHKSCNFTTECNAKCDATFPNGASGYLSLTLCADCGQCGAECASTDLYASYCATKGGP
jgi:hypothetical protein